MMKSVLLFLLTLFFFPFASGDCLSSSLWENLARRHLQPPLKRVSPVVPREIKAPKKDYEKEFEEKLREAESYFDSKEESPSGRLYRASLEELYFLPFKDHHLAWKNSGLRPTIFVVLGGEVEPDDLVRNSAAEEVPFESLSSRVRRALSERDIRRAYLLKSPLFIGPSGSLRLEKVALFLSVKTCPVILVNGRLQVRESVVAAFDPEKRDFSSRRPISHREADLYGVQEPRPYILALDGGSLLVSQSYIKGLGYRTLFGGFGLGSKHWIHFGLRYSPLKLLLRPGSSTVVLYKNLIEGCFNGFYGIHLLNGLILKNRFAGNWKYGVNIHDWSNIYVAGNTIEGTRLAHGIIFSRVVSGIVYGNISLGNKGAGIMLDRVSTGQIVRNLLAGNRLGGLSLIEGARGSPIIIERNLLLRNYPYGLFIRNSSKILVRRNLFVHNLGPGVKVITADLSHQVYRNLALDPYREMSWAWLEENVFRENLEGDLKTLRGGAVGLKNNQFAPQMLILTGEVRKYNHLVLQKPLLILKGYGDPRWHEAPLFYEKAFDLTLSLLTYFVKEGHPEARTVKGLILSLPPAIITSTIPRKVLMMEANPPCARRWFLSAALRGEPNAMVFLGGLELKYALAPPRTALKWLVLGALYGGKDGFLMLRWAAPWWGLTGEEVFQALEEILSETDCSGTKLPPWPELMEGCRPDPQWAEVLRARLRKVLHESGYCTEGAAVEKVWEYLEDEGLAESKTLLERQLQNIRALIEKKNAGRLAFYKKLEEISGDLRRALAESDPMVMRVIAREEEKRKWQEFFQQKTFAEDLKLIREFESALPAPKPPKMDSYLQ